MIKKSTLQIIIQVFDKNEKNLEKKVKQIGTYLTYIGAQKRAGARFGAPLGVYKARGRELIATWAPYKQKETLISSAERSGAGKFWVLVPLRCQENAFQCGNINDFQVRSEMPPRIEFYAKSYAILKKKVT